MSRVDSKNLFHFVPTGVLDDDVSAFQAQMKAASGDAEKELNESLSLDDPECVNRVVNWIRPLMTSMEPMFANNPIFVAAMNACNHSELLVETGHAGQYSVSVLVHKPKSLLSTTGGDQAALPPPAAIIYAHGGGAVSGRASQYKPILSALAVNCGVVVFNVDYRLAPEVKCPDNVKDFYSVIKHVAANAEGLGVDPSRLAISGESGGGYICFGAMVLLAQRDESHLVKLAIPNIPMISDYSFSNPLAMTEIERKHAIVQRAIWKAIARDLEGQRDDPLLFPAVASDQLLAKFPPTVIVECEFDIYLTEATVMARRLRQAGRLLEFAVIPGTLHGYAMMMPNLKCAKTEKDVFMKTVKEYLL